jgi:hypothetical protein
LAPLGYLSYGQALIAWLVLSSGLYVLLIRSIVERSDQVAAYKGLAMLAAVAFPPFFDLVLHGQLSVIALASVVAAGFALRAGRVRLAGAALGILGYKLSLGVPVLVILVVAGAWEMLVAALAVMLGQVVIGSWAAGPGSLETYARMLVDSPRLITTLAAKPYQMHSWRAFWLLLCPPTAAVALYALCAGATALIAASVWRRTTDPSLRMSALVIGMVLCAPHLYVYDLVVLAPVWISLTDRYLSHPNAPAIVGRTLYVGYAAPLASPIIARWGHVQVSVVCLAGLHVYLWQLAGTAGSSRSNGPRNAPL